MFGNLDLKKILAAVVIAGLCLLNIGSNFDTIKSWLAEDNNAPLKVEKYTVQNGDTFWDVTRYYRDKDARNLYIFDYQDEVRSLNPQLKEQNYQLQPNDVITVQYADCDK